MKVGAGEKGSISTDGIEMLKGEEISAVTGADGTVGISGRVETIDSNLSGSALSETSLDAPELSNTDGFAVTSNEFVEASTDGSSPKKKSESIDAEGTIKIALLVSGINIP